MKRRFQVGLILAIAITLMSCGQDNKSTQVEKQKTVTIITLLSHPSLNSTIEGFRLGLSDNGYSDSKLDLKIENALGDLSRIPILTKLAVEERRSLVFVVTTPAASAAIRITDPARIPLVYSAVTEPVAAGIVTSMDGSTTYATGVSDRYDVGKQIKFFKKIVPDMKRIGILYSAGEQNSNILADETVREAQAVNLGSRRYVIEDISRFPVITKQALEENDAIVINGDNKLIDGLSIAVNLAVSFKKPLFVGDPDSVRKGALATVGPSYFDIGRRAGQKAAEILQGKDVRTIPSEHPSGFDYIINLEAARSMGVAVPNTAWEGRTIWQSSDQ
jgi:putative ABC transport system substrate-binding protein